MARRKKNNNNQLLNQLSNLLAQMKVNSKPKAKKQVVPVGQPGMPPSSNPRSRKGAIKGDGTMMRVSREELMFTVTTDSKGWYGASVPINPLSAKDQFSWLAGLASSWERIVWNSLSFHWRSAVGTTADGSVAYGVDWESNNSMPKDRTVVTSLSPVADHPVWQTTQGKPMVCPKRLLQSRLQYLLTQGDVADRGPGVFKVMVQGAAASKMIGEFWISYDVSMYGPRKA
uniref:Capsid protein n=1 Tax=Soybean thrips permutotetra-like virus 3 TaxID=2801047 RepID=A0A7T8IMM9_9VIRU|nr:capsid protein precursor [Soybean thrips permutotetra-like virus 3]